MNTRGICACHFDDAKCSCTLAVLRSRVGREVGRNPQTFGELVLKHSTTHHQGNWTSIFQLKIRKAGSETAPAFFQ